MTRVGDRQLDLDIGIPCEKIWQDRRQLVNRESNARIELLANAIQAGLVGNFDLEANLAGYQSAFRERTMRVFEYTLRAAALKDPTATIPLYSKIAQSREETERFMDVLAGSLDFKQFFTPANISRLLA